MLPAPSARRTCNLKQHDWWSRDGFIIFPAPFYICVNIKSQITEIDLLTQSAAFAVCPAGRVEGC